MSRLCLAVDGAGGGVAGDEALDSDRRIDGGVDVGARTMNRKGWELAYAMAAWLGDDRDENKDILIDKMNEAMIDDVGEMVWLLWRVMKLLRWGGVQDVTGPRFKAAIMMIAGRVSHDPAEIAKIADVWPEGGIEGVVGAMHAVRDTSCKNDKVSTRE